MSAILFLGFESGELVGEDPQSQNPGPHKYLKVDKRDVPEAEVV
jgi:hypothetical protein